MEATLLGIPAMALSQIPRRRRAALQTGEAYGRRDRRLLNLPGRSTRCSTSFSGSVMPREVSCFAVPIQGKRASPIIDRGGGRAAGPYYWIGPVRGGEAVRPEAGTDVSGARRQ